MQSQPLEAFNSDHINPNATTDSNDASTISSTSPTQSTSVLTRRLRATTLDSFPPPRNRSSTLDSNASSTTSSVVAAASTGRNRSSTLDDSLGGSRSTSLSRVDTHEALRSRASTLNDVDGVDARTRRWRNTSGGGGGGGGCRWWL